MPSRSAKGLLMAALSMAFEPGSAARAGDAIDQEAAEIMAEWEVPGAVVVVVEEGEIAAARAYGVEDLETEEPVAVDGTVFRLASISKPITALAAARLAEQGRLDLDGDVHDYLPSHRFRGEGVLTTRHLLTHTGGFEDRFLERMSRDPLDMPPLDRFLARQMPRRIYPAGEISLYSNHGIALAGLVIESIASRPFEEAVRELVFRPLAMDRTSFELGEVRESLAQGHRFGRPVRPMGIKTVPASMLASTGGDMGRLMVALLSPEDSALAPATVERLLARQHGAHPSLTGRALGWSEDSSVTPRRVLHSGALDGFSAAIVLVPERRGGVFVAFNGNAYVWPLVRGILDRRFPAEPVAMEEALGPEIAAEGAVGRYAPASLPRGAFDKARLLFEQVEVGASGAGALEHRGTSYLPEAGGVFRSKEGRLAVIRRFEDRTFLLEEGERWLRLPWHARWPLHLGALLVLCVALILEAAGRPPFVERNGGGAGWPARWARLSAALNLLFLVAIGSFIAFTMARGGGVLRFEIPWYLVTLLALPLVALLLAALSIWAEVRRAGALPIRRWRRLPVLSRLVTSAAFATFLAYWNLLGFHF